VSRGCSKRLGWMIWIRSLLICMLRLMLLISTAPLSRCGVFRHRMSSNVSFACLAMSSSGLSFNIFLPL
jgi:hypothetical protein